MRKRLIEAMKISLTVALLLAHVATSSAQDGGRWQAPGGHFSLDFREWGWTELPSSYNDPETGSVLGIEHRRFQDGGLMRTCFVQQRRGEVPDHLSQEALNAMALRTTGDLDGVAPSSFTRVELNGVLVSDAVHERPYYQRARWFYVSEGNVIVQFLIACGATGEVPEEVVANIDGMLRTLRFGDAN